MSRSLIHSQVPRALKPILSHFRVGNLCHPVTDSGPRVLAPTWSNVCENIPELDLQKKKIYGTYCGLSGELVRPSEPVEVYTDLEIATFAEASRERRNGQMRFCPFQGGSSVVRLEIAITATSALEAGFHRGPSFVYTPTLSGLRLVRSNVGVSLRMGRYLAMKASLSSCRYSGIPRSENYSIERIEDGVLLMKIPPEKLLELFGVIVVD